MCQVTLLFPSFQAFRLWCKAMQVLPDQHEANTLHRDNCFLGHYYPAPDTLDGIRAEILISGKGGKQYEHATV